MFSLASLVWIEKSLFLVHPLCSLALPIVWHHQWDLNIEGKVSVNSFNIYSNNNNDNEGLGVLLLHVCTCQSVARC